MKNQHAVHNIHAPLFTFAWDRAERVNLILFSDDGQQILAVQKGEAFDILRGAREWDDDTLEDTVRREARDQAGVVLDAVTIAAILSTQEELLADVSYELVMTAFVLSQEARTVQETKSVFIDKETFLEHYAFGNREEMETLIGMAEDYRLRRHGIGAFVSRKK